MKLFGLIIAERKGTCPWQAAVVLHFGGKLSIWPGRRTVI